MFMHTTLPCVLVWKLLKGEWIAICCSMCNWSLCHFPSVMGEETAVISPGDSAESLAPWVFT